MQPGRRDGEPAPTGSAVSDFYRDQYAGVVKYLVHVGAAHHEAEDAAQEAMIRLFRNWPGISNHHGWVRRVALNVFLSARNKANREAAKTLAMASLISVDDGHFDDPGEAESVRKLLAVLPPAQRTTFALFVDGLTVDEVAAALHAPAATVRSNRRHARERLKRNLPADMQTATEPTVTTDTPSERK